MKRSVLLLIALGALVFVPLGGARAETTTAATTDEAWYATPPTCALPTGCGPTEALPPVQRYPAGTLHVGVTAGLEDSRTYLKLDLGAIPAGGRARGGTLTLAVAPASDGSVRPEAAQVVACWVNDPFTPVEGSLAPPPSVDCSNPAPATYVPGPPAVMTVDLANFAARWATGEANNGIALVPAADRAPNTTWHVAFSAGTARASLEYDPAPAAPVSEPPPPIVEEPGFVDLDFDSGLGPVAPVLALPPPPASPAAAIVAQAETPETFAPAFVTGGPGFAYPVVMAIPLLLLILGGYLGWALTQPVAQAES